MKRIAIIHTTPATVEPLKALARELLPGYDVVNFVDDSILPQLAESEGDLSLVEPRVLAYARFAEQVGASGVLEACSSIGELVAPAQAAIDIPLVRIDDAMAEEAIRRGQRIGVAATLQTTLGPTTRLLREKARAAGREIAVTPLLVDEAYRRLMAGDATGHDRILAEALTRLAGEVEVVVLAQASMARVLPTLPPALQEKFLTSPRLAMERLRAVLEGGAR
ncbi:MAG: aspartate/glutamate racemase family protein [Chloroflexi bacterium]|mgnify:CR=1 FL=1|jgi:Asp/Glu/hydantoin racemase|nr:aspartate/glutamate racemase family protein [Chloroflexota bacterium]